LVPLQRGEDDPAMQLAPDGTVWRAANTPEGPATLALRSIDGAIEARAWGDGADLALEGVPALVGCLDDLSGFVPEHPAVVAAAQRFPGLRLCRTGSLFEAALAALSSTGLSRFEAHRAHRLLTLDFGEPAPGPGGLQVPPTPVALSAVPYFELQVRGLDAAQGDAVARLCAHAGRLDAVRDGGLAEAEAALAGVRGVDDAVVNAAALEAFGAPDAVPLGDPELAVLVTAQLTGTASGDDTALLDALEPWRGHRARVVRLLQANGVADVRGDRAAAHQR
jgi:3-methyladenine DNA glycosylase/8-oxoguanine DNA glycosylase